jgi:hypothetical protein
MVTIAKESRQMITLTLTDHVAHAFIRALEDAGCQGYANTVRSAAGCTSDQCIEKHNEKG